MSKTPSFPLRIPAETRQYLEEQAQDNDRSLQKEILSRIDLTVWMDTTFQKQKIGYSAAAQKISNMIEENLEIQKLRGENSLLKYELNQHKALNERLIERFEKGNQSKELNEAYRQACELKETLEKMTMNVPSEE